jgi:hypothetical protein
VFVTPSSSSTADASASPTAGSETLGEQPGVQTALDAISNGTIRIPATVPFFGDGLGTLYLPHDGSPATFDAPHIDTTGASVFGHDLSDAEAVALSAHACGSQGERDGVSFYTSCNQTGPLPAGEYLIFIATFGAGLPDPFPETGQCVFSFQSDVDHDADTGFQSQLPFNFLTGADVYYETLFFYNQANEFTHYVLATDHALPVRPDTGDVHGNLATSGRAWNLVSNGYAGHIVLIPADHWGDNFSAGGFCDEDRTSPAPDDFAVDALGEPSDLSFPEQIELAVDIFFPPRDQ